MNNTASAKSFQYRPDHSLAPGFTLRATLESLGMTQSDLAVRSDLSIKHINQIIKGIAPITPDTALAFEKVTKVPARVWNQLEVAHRDHIARDDEQGELASHVDWVKQFPTNELTRRKLIAGSKNRTELVREVCEFFGVTNRDAWEAVWRQPLASFRRSPSLKTDCFAMATWLRIGELRAAEISCDPFDATKFRTALRRVRTFVRNKPDDAQKRIVDVCAKSGVAVMFVADVPGTRASGAARWLTPTKASMQFSGRYKTDDHFWFSFFHEAAHILLHSKKAYFVSIDGEDVDSFETEANDFAGQILIPRRFESELTALKTSEDVNRFAKRIDCSPGVVVGRLHKERHWDDWSKGARLKKPLDFAFD